MRTGPGIEVDEEGWKAELAEAKRLATELADYDNQKHSYDPIFNRKPLKVEWSKSRAEKRTMAAMIAVLVLMAAVLIGAVLKATHDTCVLEGSPEFCVTN